MDVMSPKMGNKKMMDENRMVYNSLVSKSQFDAKKDSLIRNSLNQIVYISNSSVNYSYSFNNEGSSYGKRMYFIYFEKLKNENSKKTYISDTTLIQNNMSLLLFFRN